MNAIEYFRIYFYSEVLIYVYLNKAVLLEKIN